MGLPGQGLVVSAGCSSTGNSFGTISSPPLSVNMPSKDPGFLPSYPSTLEECLRVFRSLRPRVRIHHI
jgi:hypothetical protein